ncbi:hypothetical protein PR003_g1021 [Phytophthora rubi]|uniref:Secreted protein n=1 Tax=Phytophthora rubi TaxID=129364 RepID=A0A6A3PA02_9STRA|nr:hypothetical protein PR002_g945 [Phytophthora rubi]KAE9051777.1 hypothetical protein PR001_g1130 [Phytophthora rubi]KAE9358904.1 hypothetical protein PR003_g1021 [Phytophthora rubi]
MTFATWLAISCAVIGRVASFSAIANSRNIPLNSGNECLLCPLRFVIRGFNISTKKF